MTSLAQRLKEAREDAGLSQSELARRSGVSQSTINNIESGRNRRSRYVFDLAAALGLNPAWLADGPPAAKLADGTTETRSEEEFEFQRRLTRSTADSHSEYFPLHDYEVSDAGDGRWTARFQGFYVHRDTLHAMGRKRIFPLRGMTQRDASMSPLLMPGDSLLVDTEAIALRDNALYAVFFEGEVIFRQVLKQIGGAIALRSLDAYRYPDKIVPAEMLSHVRVLGEVIYRAGILPGVSP